MSTRPPTKAEILAIRASTGASVGDIVDRLYGGLDDRARRRAIERVKKTLQRNPAQPKPGPPAKRESDPESDDRLIAAAVARGLPDYGSDAFVDALADADARYVKGLLFYCAFELQWRKDPLGDQLAPFDITGLLDQPRTSETP